VCYVLSGAPGYFEGGIIHAIAILLISGQIGQLLDQTGWVARGVLLILLTFSLFSLALILQKLGLFKSIERETTQFLRVFRATRGLPEPKSMGGGNSPLETVYAAGFRELQSQISGGNPSGKIKSMRAIVVAMQLASADQVRRVEKFMPWLATTASVTPFIGLFGTVWGVMDAFSGIGTAGGAALRVVAPGIAEALITTAAGLFTAIPAVIAYNYFVHRTKDLAARMDNFTAEVSAQIEKLNS
jgi:biopolymer transport protein TolQ